MLKVKTSPDSCSTSLFLILLQDQKRPTSQEISALLDYVGGLRDLAFGFVYVAAYLDYSVKDSSPI